MSDEQTRVETRTPTAGCIAAADFFIDFETRDGVSNAFKQSLENFPSEMDAVAAVARHINNATRAAEMLDTLREVERRIANLMRGVMSNDPPAEAIVIQEIVRAVIAAVEGNA